MQSNWNSKGKWFECRGKQGDLKLKYERKEELLKT